MAYKNGVGIGQFWCVNKSNWPNPIPSCGNDFQIPQELRMHCTLCDEKSCYVSPKWQSSHGDEVISSNEISLVVGLGLGFNDFRV